jgi:hypothetical protein
MYSHPFAEGPWWGSASGSPGSTYLAVGFPEIALGNGGRNSSTLSPDAEGGCRGEEVAEEVGAAAMPSLTAPVCGLGGSGFWSTG